MSNAKEVSRRAVMGAAALPVVGAFPATAATAGARPMGDAELIALGDQFDALVRQYREAWEKSFPIWQAVERTMVALPAAKAKAHFVPLW
jgi:hypothetical protein